MCCPCWGSSSGIFRGGSRQGADFAVTVRSTIVLIHGAQLAELTIDNGVGVSEGETLEIKKLDEDYFGEGEG